MIHPRAGDAFEEYVEFHAGRRRRGRLMFGVALFLLVLVITVVWGWR